MRCTIVLVLCVGLNLDALAAPAVIQPDEAASKDVFVYQFLPTFNFNSGGFAPILSSGKTGTGHDTRSFLQFDLSGVSLDAGETATLNLYVKSASSAGFGVDPTPVAPVIADIYYLTSPWDEATVTWATQPSIGSVVIDSQIIDSINRWVSFDITPLVQVWLANPSMNFGLAVMQNAVVNNGGFVVAVYESASGVNTPYLQIVPEPSMLNLVIVVALMALRRHRR